MFDINAIKHAFSSASTDYDAHAQLQHEVREDCLRMSEALWEKGSHILDLGAGPGGMSRSAKLLGFDWDIAQIDIAQGMCKEAAFYNPVVCANAAALPFADGAFDGVFSSLMLQWVESPIAVLREIARVLKSGGTCVLSTFVHGTLDELKDSFAKLDDAAHVSDFKAPMELSMLAAHAGFSVLVAEEEIFTSHYPDLAGLMKSLKTIGANNKRSNRARGLMTPRKFKKVETHYRENFADKKGLPASWHILYMGLRKSA